MKTELDIGKWVLLHGDYLFSLAKYKLNDDDLAKDMLQETFFAAIKAKDGFRGDSSERTWLARILNNKIIDYYRSRKKEIPMSEYLSATNRAFNEPYFDTNPAEFGHAKPAAFPQIAGMGSDDNINQAELKKALYDCIEKLPTTLSHVFLMKHVFEEKPDIICKHFNITSSNYWVIMHRAKLLLRTCLSKNWVP